MSRITAAKNLPSIGKLLFDSKNPYLAAEVRVTSVFFVIVHIAVPQGTSGM